MAREVIEKLIDDLDGSEATETIAFGLDGTTYVIDLNRKNAAALHKALAPYVKVARKGRSATGRRKASPTSPMRKASRTTTSSSCGSGPAATASRSRRAGASRRPSSISTRQQAGAD